MAPKVQPRVPNAKIRIEDVITKDGKFDSDKFWKLTDVQIADLIGDAVHDVRAYIMQPSTHKKAASSVRLLEALDKENPDLGLSHYVTLFKSMESGNGSALTKSYFDSFKQYDPDTFNLYLKHPGWEAYDRPDFDFTMYKAENMPKDAEPNTGVLTDKPLNNVSPAETSSGVLTNPPPELPKKETVIREPIDDAEMNELITKGPERTYTDRVGNTRINKEDIPTFLTDKGGSLPKEGVVVGPETSKPGVDTPLAEENSAVASSPEAKAAEVETPKVEAVTNESNPKATSETPEMKGVLTGKEEKPTEPSKGLFSKIGSHIGRNKKWYLSGLGGLGVAAYAINDLASKDSTLKSLFKGDYSTEIPNNSSASQPRIKSLDQREGAYMPERLLRFRQDTQNPFISNTNVNVDADYESINEDMPVQQVVNAPAPENNATADYVRAAYNSYIPSDAGRAYQKAIYGDPLELDRMRLQQQQQKWRDFVMRSGQSPAELVQRGLMPYDALQYV